MTDELTQVRSYLADIPELLAEASHYLTPGSAPIDPTSVRGSTIFHIPIVPAIVDLLDIREKDLDDITLNRTNGDRRLGVLPTLGLWVSLAYAELMDMGQQPMDCCPPRAHTVVGETNWLIQYSEPILELHPDFYRDIEQLWAELRQACRVRREYIPKCPFCNWRVEAIYGDDEAEGPAWWRCTGCAKTWVRDAEVKRFALTQPKMTLRQIATWLGIPRRTLNNWRQAGRFTTDSRGLAEVSHVENAAKRAGRISA